VASAIVLSPLAFNIPQRPQLQQPENVKDNKNKKHEKNETQEMKQGDKKKEYVIRRQ
jgi:hypothetical protein